MACCILHNMCQPHELDETDFAVENGDDDDNG